VQKGRTGGVWSVLVPLTVIVNVSETRAICLGANFVRIPWRSVILLHKYKCSAARVHIRYTFGKISNAVLPQIRREIRNSQIGNIQFLTSQIEVYTSCFRNILTFETPPLTSMIEAAQKLPHPC
jgi:hypothetical protein